MSIMPGSQAHTVISGIATSEINMPSPKIPTTQRLQVTECRIALDTVAILIANGWLLYLHVSNIFIYLHFRFIYA